LILSRSSLKDSSGERLPKGAYLLTVSDKGKGSYVPLTPEELNRILSEILGAKG